MKTKNSLVLLTSLIIFGCSNNSEDDLILQDIPTNNDTPTTYLSKVKTIMDNNCISCHGATPTNGAPNSLTTYAEVKDAVLNRGLIDRISRTNGAPGLMPLGGPRMTQQTIDIVIDWNNDGLLE